MNTFELLGWRPLLFGWATAIWLEATAIWLEAIAIRFMNLPSLLPSAGDERDDAEGG